MTADKDPTRVAGVGHLGTGPVAGSLVADVHDRASVPRWRPATARSAVGSGRPVRIGWLAANDTQPAQVRGLLELIAEVVEQADGRYGRLCGQARDEPVDEHAGEALHLGVDRGNRLIGERSR
jgi:hypothetical protein